MNTTHTMNDGCEIHFQYLEQPGKPTLILSNSLGTSMSMWDPQASIFAQHFSLLTYDSRGHGNSGVFPGAYSIDRLGCDVIALLDFLNIETTHFCGLSIGGMIGQWLAVRHPERISSLVLANTSAQIAPPSLWQGRIEKVHSDGMSSIWDQVLSKWFTPEFIASGEDRIAPMQSCFLSTDAHGYAGCCAAIRDMDMRHIARLNKLPTLIVAGKHDSATPVEHAEFLLDQCRDGRMLELEAAHISNVEQAEKFNNGLLAFLT